MKPIATLDQALGQVAKLTRLLREVGLPDDAYQWPIDHPEIRSALVEYWKSLDPKLVTEVAQAQVGMKPWLTPKHLFKQIDILAREFNLSTIETFQWMDMDFLGLALPDGCYWAAFPSRRALLERAHSTFALFGDAHAAITDLMLTSLGNKVRFEWNEEQILTHGNLQIDKRTAAALDLIEADQPGDIWILPCQLGWTKVNQSVQCVRNAFLTHPEFGLPAWMAAAQLFIHHEEISDTLYPFIECAGDSVPDHLGDLSYVPLFYFVGNGVHFFGGGPLGGAAGDYGSASAFLPQVTLDSFRV